jgi:DNA-binding NarL/FixJ family response regulator
MSTIARAPEKQRNTGISLVIVDDEAFVLAGTAALCGRMPGMDVVGTCLTGTKGMALIERLKPTVALVKSLLDDVDGVTLAACLRETGAPTGVILIAAGPDPESFASALAVPIAGYLLRTSPPDEVALAIRTVAEGNVYFASPLHQYMLPANRAEIPVASPPLTGRQRRIVRLLSQGKTSKEIGEVLGSEWPKVDKERIRLMTQLGVPNAAALVAYAYDHRLIPLPGKEPAQAPRATAPEPSEKSARRARKTRSARGAR